MRKICWNKDEIDTQHTARQWKNVGAKEDYNRNFLTRSVVFCLKDGSRALETGVRKCLLSRIRCRVPGGECMDAPAKLRRFVCTLHTPPRCRPSVNRSSQTISIVVFTYPYIFPFSRPLLHLKWD